MPHEHTDRAPHGRFGPAFAAACALNLALVLAQVCFGLLANSTALLADAVHNGGDVLGLFAAWGAFLLGHRKPTARHTYGWGRSTILAALANAVVLLVSTGAILVEAVQRLLAPAPVAATTVAWVAAAAVVVNGATALLFLRGHDDLNIRATFLHMAGDAAVSGGVLLAALAIGMTGVVAIDPAVSLVIAVLLIVSSWKVLRDAVNLAMDGVPARLARREVEAWLCALPGVLEAHDLHIWALSTTRTALTAHLVCSEAADPTLLVPRACRGLAERFAITHSTLQIETEAMAAVCDLRSALPA
jgi:cobalt-zinc-cadmium efflux system protein